MTLKRFAMGLVLTSVVGRNRGVEKRIESDRTEKVARVRRSIYFPSVSIIDIGQTPPLSFATTRLCCGSIGDVLEHHIVHADAASFPRSTSTPDAPQSPWRDGDLTSCHAFGGPRCGTSSYARRWTSTTHSTHYNM